MQCRSTSLNLLRAGANLETNDGSVDNSSHVRLRLQEKGLVLICLPAFWARNLPDGNMVFFDWLDAKRSTRVSCRSMPRIDSCVVTQCIADLEVLRSMTVQQILLSIRSCTALQNSHNLTSPLTRLSQSCLVNCVYVSDWPDFNHNITSSTPAFSSVPIKFGSTPSFLNGTLFCL